MDLTGRKTIAYEEQTSYSSRKKAYSLEESLHLSTSSCPCCSACVIQLGFLRPFHLSPKIHERSTRFRPEAQRILLCFTLSNNLGVYECLNSNWRLSFEKRDRQKSHSSKTLQYIVPLHSRHIIHLHPVLWLRWDICCYSYLCLLYVQIWSLCFC